MRILYVSGMFYPSTGGAEISVYTLLKELAKRNDCEIAALTDERYPDLEDGIKVYFTDHGSREEKLKEAVEDFRPDLIFTQLMWSDIALKKSNDLGLPSVLRVCKIPFSRDISDSSKYSPTKIIQNSHVTGEFIKEKFGRESTKAESPIDVPKLRRNYSNISGKYITMFNPIKRKGGGVFKAIAKELDGKNFAVVQGWSSLKEEGSDSFSDEYLERVSESIKDGNNGERPEEVDMSNLENVRYIKPRMNVWEIYEKVKLLLVPSQWEETFGRVSIEAMSLGIPVLASKVGGLKDVVSDKRLLVEDYSNKEEWVEKIRKLEDPEYYEKVSKVCRDIADDYSLNEIIEAHFEVFKEAVEQGE